MPFGAKDNKFKSNVYKCFYAYDFLCMYPLFLIPRSHWPETNIMKTKFKNEKLNY